MRHLHQPRVRAGFTKPRAQPTWSRWSSSGYEELDTPQHFGHARGGWAGGFTPPRTRACAAASFPRRTLSAPSAFSSATSCSTHSPRVRHTSVALFGQHRRARHTVSSAKSMHVTGNVPGPVGQDCGQSSPRGGLVHRSFHRKPTCPAAMDLKVFLGQIGSRRP